jgi:predicted nuclease of restriction endonuclease-like (RecB) superfamily
MKPPAPSTPTGYASWLSELKTRIRETRVRAALAVNSELISLYWRIGRDIIDRQAQDGWGTKVVDRLATDLRAEFPNARGFSSANLRYMRAFAEAWPDPAILQRVVGKLPWGQNIELLTVKEVADETMQTRGVSVTRLGYAPAGCEGGRDGKAGMAGKIGCRVGNGDRLRN